VEETERNDEEGGNPMRDVNTNIFNDKQATYTGLDAAFRILIVDDSLADAELITILMKNVQHPHEEYVVQDASEAIDFLHQRGKYAKAPRPNLILLDINMPGMSGLELLSRVKQDLYINTIPVIMLSTTNSPEEVRRSYQLHANAFVQKATDLDTAQRLIQSIQGFWMNFAVLPPVEQKSAYCATMGRPHEPSTTVPSI